MFAIGSGTALLSVAGLYLYLAPKLPPVELLRDVKLQLPLRVYSLDGLLIGEFGEKRRIPVSFMEVPLQLQQAFLAAEDDRFFEHPGVDYQGLLRAVYTLIKTGEKRQGGSTITMQVARNFFLSREKTYLRKFNEILLAIKIEQELTKPEILELYLNKIYLGHRSYGVGAAAQVYYGKEVTDLTLAQMAMIAGLPKAPSRYNPIANPERALQRRNYVLRRMLDLNHLTQDVYENAAQESITASVHAQPIEVHAEYVAEAVRNEMVNKFGDETYSHGYRAFATISSRLQRAAYDAVRLGLHDYDRRHGFRGALSKVNLPQVLYREALDELLDSSSNSNGALTGVVVVSDRNGADLYLKSGDYVLLAPEAVFWNLKQGDSAAKPIPDVSPLLKPGDVVQVKQNEEGEWIIYQEPEVEGALVSISPYDGAILALVGGYDFSRSHFNRVLQSERQPGSNFKPFIYSAALDKGLTAASLINDAPVVFDDPGLGSTWRPENYSGRFFGPTRLRQALIKSRNLVSIRLLNQIGVGYTVQFATRFGFKEEKLPHDLSLALGSVSVTPLEIVRGYSLFANNGHLIEPYLINRVEGRDGEILFQADPLHACQPCGEPVEALPEAERVIIDPLDIAGDETILYGDFVEFNEPPPIKFAPQTLDPRTNHLITSIMRDVVKRGTGRRAKVLKRNDLAGKTGTTNDQRDAWFSGFNRDLVTTAWVGFDDGRTLGDRETGGRAALPIWINYMREALRGVPEAALKEPEGFVTARIDSETGLLANSSNRNAIFEIFRAENLAQLEREPETTATSLSPSQPLEQAPAEQQLF